MIFSEEPWLNSYILFTQNIEMSSCRDHTSYQGPVSRNSRELFGPEKPFVKLQPAYSVKLIFSHVVKGIKIKMMAKFRASFWRYKENYVTRNTPENFQDFQETGPRFLFLLSKPRLSVSVKKMKFCPKIIWNEVFYNFAAICFGVLISFALKYPQFQCKITLTPALTTWEIDIDPGINLGHSC